MNTAEDLRKLLLNIDHRGYPAYKETRGIYDFGTYQFGIDHVQGDSFAAPSDVSVRLKQKNHGFPVELYDTGEKRTALQDYLLRVFGQKLKEADGAAKGSGKSGRVFISRPGAEILERTSCQLGRADGELTVRFQIGFPANGRTINSRELMKVIFDKLPECVEQSLRYTKYNQKQREQVKDVAELAEDQTALRQLMKQNNLAAFVQNGAVLPRESGASFRPMKGAVPFQSPESMEVSFMLPHYGKISGMGIKKGITLIVGGGYHGKSTLLEALELGVYEHVKGDGREFVLCDKSALKSRAEDGRPVHAADISCFIKDLPNGKDTACFSTEDASGSTSQAAGMLEGIAAGAKVLLIDEDTSATNFMIRDELMQRVVHADEEPICPFINRVRDLYEEMDISTILVAGSSGAYFYVADTIIQMKEYLPEDITEQAKHTAKEYAADATLESSISKDCLPANCAERINKRIPLVLREFQNPRLKIRTNGKDGISIDHEEINLRLVEQLADEEQLHALGEIFRFMQQKLVNGKNSQQEILARIEEILEKEGLERFGTKQLARPRMLEIAACMNRYRSQKYK